jgi:hypothetical protein
VPSHPRVTRLTPPGLQVEGVLAYFTHLKHQKRIGDDVGDILLESFEGGLSPIPFWRKPCPPPIVLGFWLPKQSLTTKHMGNKSISASTNTQIYCITINVFNSHIFMPRTWTLCLTNPCWPTITCDRVVNKPSALANQNTIYKSRKLVAVACCRNRHYDRNPLGPLTQDWYWVYIGRDGGLVWLVRCWLPCISNNLGWCWQGGFRIGLQGAPNGYHVRLTSGRSRVRSRATSD